MTRVIKIVSSRVAWKSGGSSRVVQRATQKDVARVAAVSRATVSYVLNNRTDGNVRISEQTRRRILTAVEQLGYRVNRSARGLKTRRTQLLAVLVPDLNNPFYPVLIRGAQKAAYDADYRLIISDSFSTSEGEKDFLETALGHIADGLILASFHLDANDIGQLLTKGVPCVGIGPRLWGTGIDVVQTDQHTAVRAIIDHLVSRGRRRIAHIAGDLTTLNGQIRLEAYREALQAYGLPADERLVIQGTFRREGVAARVESYLSAASPEDRPNGLFAANDVMAIEAMKAIQRLGLRIPDDIAVCGIDNIPEAEYVEPPLTTIGNDVELMGREAVRLLTNRIQNGSSEEPICREFPFELIVRESS